MKMKSFFWDRLPDSRVDGTFWELHTPDYELLQPHLDTVEQLFQVR